MSHHQGHTDAAEPPVRQPDLAALVELARNQRLAPARDDADVIVAAAQRWRAARRRTWVAFGGVALAAAAVLWSVASGRLVLRQSRTDTEQAAMAADGPATTQEAAIRGSRRSGPALSSGTVAADSEFRASSPEDLGAHTGSKPDGGRVSTRRREPERSGGGSPTAAELARLAEVAMAQGRRDDAIDLLTRVVTKFPRSGPCRGALLDLGRLFRQAHRVDEARCAYQMILRRWPADPARPDVERSLRALGPGHECRGLVPNR